MREIDHLAQLFDPVVHVAPLHAEHAPESALAYESPRVRLRAVRPAGGEQWRDKLTVLARYPSRESVRPARTKMIMAAGIWCEYTQRTKKGTRSIRLSVNTFGRLNTIP